MPRTKRAKTRGARAGAKHRRTETASADPRGDLPRAELAPDARSVTPGGERRAFNPTEGAPAPTDPVRGHLPPHELSVEDWELLVICKIPETLVISRRAGQFPTPIGPQQASVPRISRNGILSTSHGDATFLGRDCRNQLWIHIAAAAPWTIEISMSTWC